MSWENAEVIFGSAVTCEADARAGVRALLNEVVARVVLEEVNLAFLFASPHFDDDLPAAAAMLRQACPDATLLGCTGEGVIGNDQEVEGRPAMSLLVGHMPDVELHPFRINHHQHVAARGKGVWEPILGVSPESHPVLIALADPFMFDVMTFVEDMNRAFPGRPLFGGVASAAEQPGQNILILNGDIFREGVVGVALTGNIEVNAVVSQGCRPIGRRFIVTKSQDRFIRELGGKVAWEQLQTVINELTPEEERLAQQAIFLGRAIDEYKPDLKRGDFLIQNLIGVERSTGALAVAGIPKIGSTVQFHVRDAASADEDLRQMLESYAAPLDPPVAGALLFSCNGRGRRMWPDTPSHDARVLREYLGDVPVAGFFCGGEFGPVCGRNFVHGFTASIAMLRSGKGEHRAPSAT